MQAQAHQWVETHISGITTHQPLHSKFRISTTNVMVMNDAAASNFLGVYSESVRSAWYKKKLLLFRFFGIKTSLSPCRRSISRDTAQDITAHQNQPAHKVILRRSIPQATAQTSMASQHIKTSHVDARFHVEQKARPLVEVTV